MNSCNNQSLYTFKIIYNDILNSITNNENIIISKDRLIHILKNILPLGTHEWKSENSSLYYHIKIEENFLLCFENKIKHGLCIDYNNSKNISYGIYNKGLLQTFVTYYNDVNQIFSSSKINKNCESYIEFHKNGNTKINRFREYYNIKGGDLKCFNSLFNTVKYCTNKKDFIQKYYKNGNIKEQYNCHNHLKYGYYNSWNEKGDTKKALYYHNTNYYIIPDDLVIIVKLQTKIRMVLKKIRLQKWLKSRNFSEWWWHPDNTGGRWVKNSLLKIVESV